MADESGAFFDGDQVAQMILSSTLNGRIVKWMVSNESFASVAEQWLFMGKKLSKIKAEHEIPVYSLHVVEAS